MTDPAALTATVAAALERGIMPSVIARGAALRVASVADGIVTLEVTGSPGAVLPLAGRIEALLRSAVPGITSVRLAVPAAAQADDPSPRSAADLAEAARAILDAEVNPAIAAHHGRITVVGVTDGWIRVQLEGGCQGCSLAEVTLRQGVEPLLRARQPTVTGLVDVTDHEAGTEPFYSPKKR
ncbi:MAG: NifU family protein [Acidimicrobiales bacterium]